MPKHNERKINVHGVHISDVSTTYASFSKHSEIPNDITQADIEKWAERRDALVMPRVLKAMIALDVSYSGYWLHDRLEALRTCSDSRITQLCRNHGQRSALEAKNAWKHAVNTYTEEKIKQDKEKK